jgi:hypothetical protein
MDGKEIKKFVNTIFTTKGQPKIKNFAADFSDGCKP